MGKYLDFIVHIVLDRDIFGFDGEYWGYMGKCLCCNAYVTNKHFFFFYWCHYENILDLM